MTSRARIPPVVFLALTDAVTGMIGILLVVLVLARPPQEEVHRLQQADSRIACVPTRETGATAEKPATIRLLDSGEQMPLVDLLAARRARGAISVRLAVASDRTDAEVMACLARLRSEVERLNEAYQGNRADIRLPYVFLSPYPPEPGGNTGP